jgi:hypothetical protein
MKRRSVRSTAPFAKDYASEMSRLPFRAVFLSIENTTACHVSAMKRTADALFLKKTSGTETLFV